MSLAAEDIVGTGASGESHQYICPVCSEVLKNAVQTAKCGHHLCQECAELIIYRDKDQTQCPKQDCGELLVNDNGSQYFPDNAVRKRIACLQTFCPISNCGWKGAYKYLQSHQDKEHPPSLLEAVPKRRASHALVTIKDQETVETTPQKLRDTAHQLQQSANDLLQQADNIEMVSKKAECVERVSANSLRRDQAGVSASSNKSLKRAEDLKMFSEARSHTLDASAAADMQIRFETDPAQVEHTTPAAQVSQQQGQLVAGAIPTSQQPHPILTGYQHDSDAQPISPKSLLPPISNPLSREKKSDESTSQKHSAAAYTDASAPGVSPRIHQRHERTKASPHLPPLKIKNPTQVVSAKSPGQSPTKLPTLSPFQTTTPTNPLQPLSPSYVLSRVPPFSTQAPPTNVLYEPIPLTVPPPFVLRAKNLPVPSSLPPTSPRAKQSKATPSVDSSPLATPKSSTMPGVSGDCTIPECIANKKKNQVLTAMLKGKENTGCVHCKKKLGRARFQSF